MIENHYEGKTPYILLNGITPFMNSLPYHKLLLTNKLIKKNLKQYPSEHLMNIAFEKPQDVKTGDVLSWTLDDLVMKVTVLTNDKIL
ncbi:hypothetical protein [Kluyvera cryocrescens]|uniref:hypothetical protein n=1 Tax=Kluyvera cryocrescens TaxID=580 RepID=UPI00248CA5B4|nr:hypothetical protein [Kluyvera cryocrescens]